MDSRSFAENSERGQMAAENGASLKVNESHLMNLVKVEQRSGARLHQAENTERAWAALSTARL